MEQKLEHVEEQAGPKAGMWLPSQELEEAASTLPHPSMSPTHQETKETVPIVPPLPSHLIAPPAYFAPTELNLKLYQMGRETPWREAGLIGLWACFVPLLCIWFLVSLGNGEGWGVLGSSVSLAFLLHYNRLLDSLSQARAALSLSGFGKEWVGGYIEALLWPNSRIQGLAATALTYLLPRLTPEDASLLTVQHREILYTRLHSLGSRLEFRIAILKALGVVGDEHSVPSMERLADTIAWTPRQARLRTAAREALAILEERLAAQRKTEASSSEGTIPEASVIQEAVEVSPEEEQQRIKQVDELLEQMEQEARSRRQPAMRIGFLIANWAIIVPYLGIKAVSSLTAGEGSFAVFIWALLCLGATQMYRFTLSAGQSEAARKLSNVDDIRAVSRLAEVLDWPDQEIQFAARKGLTRLLPRLHSTDSKLLNERQRHSLYKSLKMSNAHREEELIIAILKAMEQVGDKEAIPYVQRLADCSPRSLKEKRIRDQAAQCLPYLLVRAEANESSMVLLRGSSASEMSPEILLRPASAHQGEAAEELLRPSADDT